MLQGLVDRLDVIVGQLLDLVGPEMVVVLGHLVITFHVLQLVHPVAAHVLTHLRMIVSRSTGMD